MEDLISIIIPTYNHGIYLDRCLNSIQQQTIDNYEVIIIDNNSTDNTKDVIKKYINLPIKYYLISNKGIYAKSRNMGIKNSSGNIIAFLDSDDWWKKEKLYECYKKINEGYDLIYHNLKLVGKKFKFKTNIIRGRKLKYPKFKDLIINGNKIWNSSVVVKKEILKKVKFISEKNEMKAAEDYNTWIKVCRESDKIYFLDKILGFYQFHEGGGSRKNMSFCSLEAIREFKKNLTSGEYKKARSRIIYMNAKFFYEKKIYHFCNKKFKISFLNGSFLIKLKSLLYLILLSVKK